MFGKKKHGDFGWKTCKNAKNEYYDKVMRHLTAWGAGEIYDPESGNRHLDHALADLMILRYHDDK